MYPVLSDLPSSCRFPWDRMTKEKLDGLLSRWGIGQIPDYFDIVGKISFNTWDYVAGLLGNQKNYRRREYLVLWECDQFGHPLDPFYSVIIEEWQEGVGPQHVITLYPEIKLCNRFIPLHKSHLDRWVIFLARMTEGVIHWATQSLIT